MHGQAYYKLFLKYRVGSCGAWSFDTFEETCYLHTAYSCCAQFDKRESDSNFISGYTCNQCWSTRNECPCGNGGISSPQSNSPGMIFEHKTNKAKRL